MKKVLRNSVCYLERVHIFHLVGGERGDEIAAGGLKKFFANRWYLLAWSAFPLFIIFGTFRTVWSPVNPLISFINIRILLENVRACVCMYGCRCIQGASGVVAKKCLWVIGTTIFLCIHVNTVAYPSIS